MLDALPDTGNDSRSPSENQTWLTCASGCTNYGVTAVLCDRDN